MFPIEQYGPRLPSGYVYGCGPNILFLLASHVLVVRSRAQWKGFKIDTNSKPRSAWRWLDVGELVECTCPSARPVFEREKQDSLMRRRTRLGTSPEIAVRRWISTAKIRHSRSSVRDLVSSHASIGTPDLFIFSPSLSVISSGCSTSSQLFLNLHRVVGLF